MPLATVRLPGPPAFATFRAVSPVAEPPSMTSLSDGEPSPFRNVLRPIVPPTPT
jgi:hypothetical protein